MGLQRQLVFWVLGLTAFIAALYILREILLPFVAGMALAYFLDPIADRLERIGLSRLLSTCTILVVFTLIFIAFLVVPLPMLGSQIYAFAEKLPGHIDALIKLVNEGSPDWLKSLLGQVRPHIVSALADIGSKGAPWVAAIAQSLWSGGVAFISFISLFFVTPIVAFYLLYDWDRMVERIDGWLPRDHAETIRKLGREIDATMAGFLRGQVTVCLILAAFYAAGLSLIGLDFGLLIGLGAGLLSFVPYVGAIVGLLVSGGVAVVQFWPDWPMVAAVLGVFLAGQALEGNFLSPKLVGGSVGLHPVWLMFALFAFGLLFGFVGLLVAVPAAAAIGVLVRFALRRYLESPIYLGAGATRPGTSRSRGRRK